ncbi:hypothetical protein DYU05_19065 [Mucilaginibacter terrenus]|uniref:SGNH hydrolase-type esterase domain-containing protein n=1 Tax=Mucilaginibacter terrenus TaxID=2482727 RepID=A0A3E2NK79_9SPHI|nr:GDSL-type esterase/lipase family protein [Mucilaginibacter terrenus]RFZ81385.1 hypothetical protein DYU05_19065 [Mucilaginibacter terrenus]
MKMIFSADLNTKGLKKWSSRAGALTLIAVLLLATGCKKAGEPIIKNEGSGGVPATANLDKIVAFKNFKKTPSIGYDLVAIGDSYIQGDYYTLNLKGKLINSGLSDGGPGYCSFGRFDESDSNSIDSSIDPSQLTFTYSALQWALNQADAIGPCGDVKSNIDNAPINVVSTIPLNTMTIIYEQHPGAGSFRYRVNGGDWTTVSAEAANSTIANVIVNTSAAGSVINLDIESLKAGQRFCGVVGRKSGNLTVHKAGMSGGIAVFFGQNDQWRDAVKVLNPKGVIISFGTNEMELGIEPENLRVNVQYIINRVREAHPNCDILLMCPPETKYEKLEPKAYKIADYGAVLYQLALENNTAFVNLAAVFPHFSQASIDQGYMNADGKHPGEKGGELIAKTLYDAFNK